MSALLIAAEQWEKEAEAELARANWDIKAGVYIGVSHPGYRNSELYRKVAQAIRMEADKGEAHCLCHMQPISKCPLRIKNSINR